MKIGFGPALASKLTSQVAMISIFATATVGGVSLISSSVFATLDATATYTNQSVDAGTLLLNQTANGVGFTQPISKIAPGDIVNRYVNVINTGNIAAASLSLKVAASAPTSLDSDLTVSVSKCPTAWIVATATCTGGLDTPILNAVTLSSLETGILPPTDLGIALAATGNSGDHAYLQITVSMPSTVDETLNNAPVGPYLHEGATANLTWTFKELQRNGLTTNS